MNKSQTIVDEIRQILRDPEGASAERLERLAREFAERRRALDESLSEIVANIKSGEYCEAARIVETRSIREESLALNFPQWEDWRDVCRTLDLEIPTPISSEKLLTFDAFEEKFATLKDDLRRLRVLSLARAEISARLDVLYRLNEADAENPIWTRSIRRLEKYRAERIEEYLNRAKKSDETEREIAKIRAEVSRFQTISEYPKLLEKLNVGASTLKRERNEREALELAAEWDKALNDENADVSAVALDYLSRWRDFLRREQLDERSLSDAVRQAIAKSAGPSLELEKRALAEEEYRRKLASIRQALEYGGLTNVDSLRAKWDSLTLAAEAVDAPIPLDLRDEYESRVGQLELQRKRRFIARASVIAVVGVVFLVAVGIVVRNAIFNADVAKAAGEIARKLDAFEGKGNADDKRDLGALAEAEKLVDERLKDSPKTAGVELFQRTVARAESLRTAEDSRVAEIASKTDAIQKSLDANEIADADLFAQLAKLALTDDEKNRCKELKRQNDALVRERRKVVDDAYQESILRWDVALKDVKNDKTSTFEEKSAKLAEIRNGVAEDLSAPTKRNDVSQALTKRGDALAQSVEEYVERLAADENRSGLRERLPKTVGDRGAFEKALGELAEQTDDEAEKKRLTDAIADLKNVERAETWNRFVEKFGANVERWENDAASWREVADQIAEKKSELDFAPEFVDARTRCDALKDWCADGGRTAAFDALKSLYVETYATPLWLYRDETDGEYVYFVNKKPENVVNKPQFPYQIDRDGGTKNYDKNRMRSAEDYESIVEAPQYATYLALEKRFNEELSAENWFEIAAELATRLDPGKTDDGFDPVLKAIMLAETTKIIGADPDFADFATWADRIENDATFEPDVNYFRHNETLKEQRICAQKILRVLASKTPVAKTLEKARERFDARRLPITARYRWVGCLGKLENGEIGVVFAPNAQPNEDGTLWICRGETATRCGEIAEGKISVLKNFGTEYEWTPVYLLKNVQ